ncbi:MAG: putative Ig domain-containing protein, partial [Desulfosarcina sp.]
MQKAVEANRWSALFLSIVAILACALPLFSGIVRCHAAQAVCAEVRIEIKQEMTLERQAFDAHMRINNGLDHISLENVSISVRFSDADGNAALATSDPDDLSASFYIRVYSMTNIGDVTGSGVVAPSTSADIHWLIIPVSGASNGLESGTLYYVGATLSYTIGGEGNTTEVTPDTIYVKPMPEISLDYFLPLEVYGDDAFTESIEAPIPFPLGVRVRNSGHGTVRDLTIESAQPKIVENEQGLLIGFAIQGTQVNAQTATDSLRVDFGDVAPGTSETARWMMTCTLSGQFVDFDADFSHSDELGGKLTSLVNAVETHLLVRDVRVDLPGRDQIIDFLARDGDILRVYESESVDTVVADQSASSTLSYIGTPGGRPAYGLTTPVHDAFVFVRLPDPYHGSNVVHSAIRTDGKTIKSENIWFSKSRDGQSWKYSINMFDVATAGTYKIVFADPAAVPEVPVLQHLADITAIEGERISFMVQASDPDGTIPVLSVGALPAGAALADQGAGSAIFDWRPSIGQAGVYPITFQASDGGSADTQRVIFTIRSVSDTDGDGMNDAWERVHFGTLNLDGSGDFDGDGISDLDECLVGSDPKEADHAPTVPQILFPTPGGAVETPTPQLTIENSTDEDADTIIYAFELYADAQFRQVVADDLEVVETTDTTDWTVPVKLEENRHYFWRVRATDGYSFSLWTYGNFFVNATNDPPNRPAVSFPPDGGHVDTLTPVLEVTGANDPDEEVLTGSFEVYADMAMTVLVADGHGRVIPEDGVVCWNVDPSLDDDTSYFWRVLVADGQGRVSQTALAMFTVVTANRAPTLPNISLPTDGDEVASTAEELVVVNGVDADGDALGYYFEIDTEPGFNGHQKRTSVMIDQGAGTTAWPVSDLKDNTTYYWRAMATDTTATSQWATGRFFVNRANDNPGVPTLKNPGQDAWVGVLTPDVSVAKGIDPDQDSLTYRYEVFTEPSLENRVAWNETLSTSWTVVTGLTDKTRYYWRARAVDEHGEEGSWMPTASFYINEQEQPPLDAITVQVSTDKERPLENIRVYAFTSADAYAGIHATTGPEGKAIFGIDALAPGAYRFRADYMGQQFWSATKAIPETVVIPILIEEETVTVTVNAASGLVTGTRVHLYSESGAYLGIYQETDANGQAVFDLPAGETFFFRTDILGSHYWSVATTVFPGAINTVTVDVGGGALKVIVRQDDTTVMPGIRVYLFSGSDVYLGLSETTGDSGTVVFDVTESDYRLRADYLGYQFWSETIHMATDTTEVIEIEHQPAILTVRGRFQKVDTPFAGIKSSLFSANGTYLSQNRKTDE